MVLNSENLTPRREVAKDGRDRPEDNQVSTDDADFHGWASSLVICFICVNLRQSVDLIRRLFHPVSCLSWFLSVCHSFFFAPLRLCMSDSVQHIRMLNLNPGAPGLSNSALGCASRINRPDPSPPSRMAADFRRAGRTLATWFRPLYSEG